MAKALTAKAIEAARPRERRVEIPDGGCRGLYLVVQPSGRRSWAVRFRHRGKPSKLTLNGFPTLAAARRQATEVLHEVEQGRDPAAKKRAERQATAERQADTVAALAKQYLANLGTRARPSTLEQAEYVLDRVVAAWGARPVHEIARRDVKKLVKDVAERAPVTGNRTLAWLRAFFNWLCAEDVIVASPCVGVRPPTKERERERYLDDAEISVFWRACDALDVPYRQYFRALLLTGVRRAELAGMKRAEISGDVWTIPPGRCKNGRAHTVPLVPQVMQLIEQAGAAGGDYVFSVDGDTPRSRVNKAKKQLDAAMKPATPFVVHDLRRSLATGLQRLGIRLEVTESVLGHVGGSRAGIVGVYQKHEYAAEKRAALAAWAAHVDALVNGAPVSNVVSIGERR